MDEITRDSQIDLDDAIFTLAPEGLGSAQSAQRIVTSWMLVPCAARP